MDAFVFWLMILGFVTFMVFMIDYSISKKKVADYLRSNNMQRELEYLEIGTGNIRGLGYRKKFNSFYKERTEDSKLNDLKDQVNKKSIRLIKMMILGFILAWVITVLVVIIGIAMY